MRTLILFLLASLVVLASDELFDAARKGDAAAVKAALDKDVPIDAKWRYNQTALFMAAARGHVGVVRLLLERGADPNVRDSFYGSTPLTAVAGKPNPEVIMLLLDKGAQGGDDLLMTSASQGQTEMVRTLLARPGWSSATLSKALAAAQSRNHKEIVSALEKAGAKPPVSVSVDPAILASYAGTWRNEQVDLIVTASEGKLRIGMMGQNQEYAPAAADTFESVLYPGMFKVVFDGKGGMEFHRKGASEPMKFRRVEESKK